MKLVVDSNIVFSALISARSIYLEIFEATDVYVPDFIFVEMARYETRIRQQTELEDALKLFTQDLFANITVILNIAIASGSFMKAHSLCANIDPEDIPFVALSIDLDMPLWRNDKKLREGLRAKGYTSVVGSSDVFDLFV